MKLNIEQIVRSGYVAAFIMILISYLLFFISLNESINGRNQIIHSSQSIDNIDKLMSSIKDAETGVRGYTLIKDDRYLEPYFNGIRQSKDAITALDDLISPDMEVRDRLFQNIKKIVSEKNENLKQVSIMAITQNGTSSLALKNKIDSGKILMDNLRDSMAQLRARELSYRVTQEKRLTAINNSTKTIAIISLLIVALLGAYSVITFNRENKDKKAADAAAAQYASQLENRVNELDKKNIELAQLRGMEKYAATGRMASTMAHEIKNPLNNISLSMEHLSYNPEQDEEQKQLIEIVNRNVKRINDIVTNLLNATRFLVLKFIPVSLNQLIEEALEAAKDRIELNNITVIKHFDEGLCNVSVDIEKIKIAITNIIVNAIEAVEGKSNGTIEITTTSLNGHCAMILKDNGVGMDEEALSKVFEPFITSKKNGTGLGLTNTQNIILNHKGHITVESSKGEGSIFTILLPFEK
ncbi:MAG: CHASE3 domain-containing protein [Niastella sp.]|nr:CHASE3 domain-containing protein [Niastella sp.]